MSQSPQYAMSLGFLIFQLTMHAVSIVITIILLIAVLKTLKQKRVGMLYSALHMTILNIILNGPMIIPMITLMVENGGLVFFDAPNATPNLYPRVLHAVFMNVFVVFLPSIYMTGLLQLIFINTILRFKETRLKRFVSDYPL